MVVTPSERCSRAISALICTRSLASRLDSGSSIRNAWGCRTIARPIATRCRCPPDSCRGLRSSSGSSSRMRAASATRRLISSLLLPLRYLRLNAMFWRTVRWG